MRIHRRQVAGAERHPRDGIHEEACVRTRGACPNAAIPGPAAGRAPGNMRGEGLATAEANGVFYLKIPLNQFREAGRMAGHPLKS